MIMMIQIDNGRDEIHSKQWRVSLMVMKLTLLAREEVDKNLLSEVLY